MKILVWIFIFHLFVLSSFTLAIPAVASQDSLTISKEDSANIGQSPSNESTNILKWIQENAALVGAFAVIVAAVIAGLFNLRAKNIELKKKLAQAELDKQAVFEQAQARIDVAEKHKAEKKQKILKTEEDRYLDFVITENEKLTFHGFETKVRVPILLWDIYVPLRANIAGLGMRDIGHAESENMREIRDLQIQEAIPLATNRNYNGLIILGDPGAGKTTLLKYFLLCFAKKEAAKRLNLPGDLLPILLPLRSVDLSHTFIQAICEQFRDYDLRLSEDFFLNRLRKGQAIVLLDGLDEVADEHSRKQMCQWIDKARTTFSKCPFIVTSRFAGYRGDVKLPGAYFELHMRDFTNTDIRQFLHSWYTAVETALHEDSNYRRTKAQKVAEELYTRIESTKAYLKLAVNPLMLQLIALVHYDFKTVPDRRVELYEKCIDLLLQKWDESKGLKILLSAKEARHVLQPLALWMHSEENRRQASKEEILNLIKPQVQQVKPGVEAEKFLISMRDRSGVFVGYGTETYGFQHHSFQEYLTAEEIRNKNKVDVLVNHFDESWWRETTLLALGLGNPSLYDPFMARFLDSPKNNGAAADFMMKCVREALVKSEAPLEAALQNPKLHWQARHNALLCLETIGSDTAQKIVGSVLKDPQPEIADKARGLLLEWGRISAEEVVEREAATGMLARIFNPLENNAEYILIPGGTYTMGELKKQVTVGAFYLAKFPVTNSLYRLFVKTTGHREPGYWDDKRYNEQDQPVVGVTWDDSVAYCEWLTENSKGYKYRLPTEDDWEWAASRGQREYPWGNELPDHNRANYEGKVGYSTSVGSYPAGATPDGLMDMAGNVWEWTDSIYEKDEDIRVVRGGAFDDDPYVLRCAYRCGDYPLVRGGVHVGFRVVRTV